MTLTVLNAISQNYVKSDPHIISLFFAQVDLWSTETKRKKKQKKSKIKKFVKI